MSRTIGKVEVMNVPVVGMEAGWPDPGCTAQQGVERIGLGPGCYACSVHPAIQVQEHVNGLAGAVESGRERIQRGAAIDDRAKADGGEALLQFEKPPHIGSDGLIRKEDIRSATA